MNGSGRYSLGAEEPSEKTKVMDPVNHPSHYTHGDIECIDAIESAISGMQNPVYAYLTGQVLKYAWRWYYKNGIEDLDKAKWYLERLIAKVHATELVEW